jgi:hypothetical protein
MHKKDNKPQSKTLKYYCLALIVFIAVFDVIKAGERGLLSPSPTKIITFGAIGTALSATTAHLFTHPNQLNAIKNISLSSVVLEFCHIPSALASINIFSFVRYLPASGYKIFKDNKLTSAIVVGGILGTMYLYSKHKKTAQKQCSTIPNNTEQKNHDVDEEVEKIQPKNKKEEVEKIQPKNKQNEDDDQNFENNLARTVSDVDKPKNYSQNDQQNVSIEGCRMRVLFFLYRNDHLNKEQREIGTAINFLCGTKDLTTLLLSTNKEELCLDCAARVASIVDCIDDALEKIEKKFSKCKITFYDIERLIQTLNLKSQLGTLKSIMSAPCPSNLSEDHKRFDLIKKNRHQELYADIRGQIWQFYSADKIDNVELFQQLLLRLTADELYVIIIKNRLYQLATCNGLHHNLPPITLQWHDRMLWQANKREALQRMLKENKIDKTIKMNVLFEQVIDDAVKKDPQNIDENGAKAALNEICQFNKALDKPDIDISDTDTISIVMILDCIKYLISKGTCLLDIQHDIVCARTERVFNDNNYKYKDTDNNEVWLRQSLQYTVESLASMVMRREKVEKARCNGEKEEKYESIDYDNLSSVDSDDPDLEIDD